MAKNPRQWPQSGKSGRKCGKKGPLRSFSFATCTMALALGLSAAPDSAAQAKFLDNSVRAWDRSGLKTVRPPAPGAKRFAPGRAPARAPRPRLEVDWFWEAVSPARSAAAAGRWDDALDLLRARRREHGAFYDPGDLDRIGRDWRGVVSAEARRRNLSEALVLAVIAVESAGRAKAQIGRASCRERV